MYKNKILIVDDTSLYSDMLVEALHEEYELMTATDGRKAMDSLDAFRPDLVLLDVMMPEMNGFEVLQRIKDDENMKNVPVIMLTSLTDEIDEDKGLSIGATDYIRKPFNLKFLKNKIRTHMSLQNKLGCLEDRLSERNKVFEEGISNLIKSLGIVAEYRDETTGEHIDRTRNLMNLIAREMQPLYPSLLSDEMIEVISNSAVLHDIGKIGIPDAILQKKGRLTEEEYGIIKLHTIQGKEMIDRIESTFDQREFLETAKIIAEYHHEKWDGSGYPHGLKGEDIPLYGRMMAIIDVYDALINERPYKKAFSHEEAMRIICEGDDRVRPEHFDPAVLEAFKKISNKLAEMKK